MRRAVASTVCATTRAPKTATFAEAVTLAQGVTLWQGWPTAISTDAVLVAFGFAAGIGVFFGFYPARKAAALDPIEALRFE